MAWKLEPWSTAVGTQFHEVSNNTASLSDRELVVVACALIDSGLAELLAQRLRGNKREIEEFLGANEDGRAPSGSFGARILLARLTGLLESGDLAVLRALKSLRNDLAHRVEGNLSSVRLKTKVMATYQRWHDRGRALGGTPPGPAEFSARLSADPKTARDAILRILTFYQKIFSTIRDRFDRIQPLILRPAGTARSGA